MEKANCLFSIILRTNQISNVSHPVFLLFPVQPNARGYVMGSEMNRLSDVIKENKYCIIQDYIVMVQSSLFFLN